ncbi:response regulator [Hyalangium rubrum]|uniref:Response regulator n=1 Tax=Hyalangium rubrum TaxID=3103134 RepID=A0ABU5H0Y2_9BACT|nr:response regulator [Hyalangium sp. s54d21]MDY7227104.1 response regulator [Hyalangium sp. s54d21]
MTARASKKRILIIDDSEAIHHDFRRLLCPERKEGRKALDLMEEALFGTAPTESPPELDFEVDSALQGQEGLEKVRQAQEAGHPYDLAFLDYRMPPGWNGVETLRHLRKVAPKLPVVLCSAYSDYSWEQILEEFPETGPLTELRKPVNRDQVREVVRTFTEEGDASHT